MVKWCCLVVLLFLSFHGFSQNVWNGEVTVNYGADFDYLGVDGRKWCSSKAGGKASAGFSGKKFSLKAGGDLSYDTHVSAISGMTFNYSMDGDISDLSFGGTDVQKIRSGAFIKAGWTLTQVDSLSFDCSGRYEHDLIFNSSAKVNVLGRNDFSFVGGREDADNTKGTHTADLTYLHQFHKPGRFLTAGYHFSFSDESKFSDWTRLSGKGKDEGGEETFKYYRILPQTIDMVNQVKVCHTEKSLAGVDRLDADFTLACKINTIRDFQRAATLVGSEWRDSVAYCENFTFDALTISPTVHVSYRIGVYTVGAEYTPEFYTRRLSGDVNRGKYDYGFISHPATLRNAFVFNDRHRLDLTYDRSVKRPEYKQICWFERAGTRYADVKDTGNPDLKPEAKHKLDLTYLCSKGIFSARVGVGYEYVFRIIEQTYTEKVSDNQKYSLYSWINGGHNHLNSASVSFFWKWRGFRAELGGRYSYFHGETSDKKLTLSSDYSLFSEVSYRLKKWQFLCKGKYDSKIIRSYTTKNERVKVDCRVSRTLGRFDVFLEALDIFDGPVKVTIKNVTRSEERYEQYDNKNKLFRIGMSFKF